MLFKRNNINYLVTVIFDLDSAYRSLNQITLLITVR